MECHQAYQLYSIAGPMPRSSCQHKKDPGISVCVYCLGYDLVVFVFGALFCFLGFLLLLLFQERDNIKLSGCGLKDLGGVVEEKKYNQNILHENIFKILFKCKKKRSDTGTDLCVWVHLGTSQLAQDALFRLPSVKGLVTGCSSSVKSSCPLPTEFKRKCEKCTHLKTTVMSLSHFIAVNTYLCTYAFIFAFMYIYIYTYRCLCVYVRVMLFQHK